MPIGSTISDPIPAVGTAGTSYASQLVAFLTEVKSRLENKVALTSLLAGLFDLDNNGLANAQYVALYEQLSAPTTPVGSLQNYGGELYYVSPSGAVRITNAGSLDVVGANGISGDYAAPAEFRYDLGSVTYQALSDSSTSPDTWGYIAARALDVFGTATSITRVRIAWPGGASWTLTLPAAPPGTQQLVQMSAAGTLVASNTLANNESLTLQGTGEIKHGTRVLTFAFGPTANVISGTQLAAGATGPAPFTMGWTMGVSTRLIQEMLGLKTGDRVQSIRLNAFGALATPTTTVTRQNRTTATAVPVTMSGSASTADLTATLDTPYTLAAGDAIWVDFATNASDTLALYSIEVTYDHP